MTEVYALIVCGGKSARMGADKGLLDYYGQPQRYYVYDLLQSLFERIFISCGEEQAAGIHGGYKLIIDAPMYKNIGPMASLLTAFLKYPDVSFMMIGCDYPFLQKEDVKKLVDARDEEHLAVSYFNPFARIREPLLAIYENNVYPLLTAHFNQKKYSLRIFLDEINAKEILPAAPEIITSVDTPEAYREAMRKIRG